MEARGFIFGPPIALAIGAKFVPMRKPKKLPGKLYHYFSACPSHWELYFSCMWCLVVTRAWGAVEEENVMTCRNIKTHISSIKRK